MKSRCNDTMAGTSMMLVVSLCLAWSTQANSFYTVYKVRQLVMYIIFQAGLCGTDTDTIKNE